MADKSGQSANIISHLIETAGRQQQAWTKSEQINNLFSTAISEECVYTEGCIDEAVRQITILRAEIDKESSEIENLWSENVIGKEFDEYYASLDENSKIRIMDLITIYGNVIITNISLGMKKT